MWNHGKHIFYVMELQATPNCILSHHVIIILVTQRNFYFCVSKTMFDPAARWRVSPLDSTPFG